LGELPGGVERTSEIEAAVDEHPGIPAKPWAVRRSWSGCSQALWWEVVDHDPGEGSDCSAHTSRPTFSPPSSTPRTCSTFRLAGVAGAGRRIRLTPLTGAFDRGTGSWQTEHMFAQALPLRNRLRQRQGLVYE
jgi:hypothetical protein